MRLPPYCCCSTPFHLKGWQVCCCCRRGFNLVVSDMDVVWLRDPLPLFEKHPHAGAGHRLLAARHMQVLHAGSCHRMQAGTSLTLSTALSSSTTDVLFPSGSYAAVRPALLAPPQMCCSPLTGAPPPTRWETKGWNVKPTFITTSTQVGAAVGAGRARALAHAPWRGRP